MTAIEVANAIAVAVVRTRSLCWCRRLRRSRSYYSDCAAAANRCCCCIAVTSITNLFFHRSTNSRVVSSLILITPLDVHDADAMVIGKFEYW